MTSDRDDIPDEVLEEMHAERKRRARATHWCSECHGRTGRGSPCAPVAPAEESEEESP